MFTCVCILEPEQRVVVEVQSRESSKYAEKRRMTRMTGQVFEREKNPVSVDLVGYLYTTSYIRDWFTCE